MVVLFIFVVLGGHLQWLYMYTYIDTYICLYKAYILSVDLFRY